MTTIICDLSVDWNGCPYCSMLKGCVESAESTCRAASERLDQAYADYREERDAGRAAIGTGQWSVWQDRLRYLEQQLTAAHDTWRDAIDEWADCIHTHRRLYEDQQREAEDGKGVAADTEEMAAIRKDEAVDALVNIYGGHIDKWLEALRERAHVQTAVDDDAVSCTCAMCQAEDGEPTDEERAAYFAERDRRDPDDGARENSREEARRVIADYMGVPPEDVHIICSGICGPADEPTTPREQDPAAPATVPLAVVKSILTKWETDDTEFRDSCSSHGLNPYGANWAIGAIKEISDDIDKLTTTEEAPNA